MSEMEEFQYDVYISHIEDDEQWVQNWFIPKLEKVGISTCTESTAFDLGAPRYSEIERIIRTSRKTILIITKKYLDNEWSNLNHLISNYFDPSARERRIIPIIREDVSIPVQYGLIISLNMINSDEEDVQMDRLIENVLREKRGQRSKILLVENEPSWVNIMNKVLSDYDIEIANNSEEGIRKLSSQSLYSLAIINIHLTDYNEASGEEVLAFIRDNQPELPRIVVTGQPFSQPIFSQFAYGYRITELIAKDAKNTPTFIRQVVRRILDPSNQHYS